MFDFYITWQQLGTVAVWNDILYLHVGDLATHYYLLSSELYSSIVIFL